MRFASLALIALCALCAGCGASNESFKVRIAIVANSTSHLAVPLADKLGYFREEGVDVIIERVPSTQKTVEALLSGSADLATGGYDQLLHLSAAGRAVRSVIVTGYRFSASIIVSPSRKNIRTINDLKGKNFGVPGLGSSNHQFAQHVFALHGLDREHVSFAGIGLGRPLIVAIERGVVDAAAVSGGDFVRLKLRHPGLTVLATSMTAEGSKAIWGAENTPSAVMFTREEWIAPNRDRLRRIVRANKRALAWLQAHSPEEILAVLPDEYRTDDPVFDLAALRMMKTLYSPDGVLQSDVAEAVRKSLSMTQENIRNANIDISKTYTNEFVLEKP